MQKQRTQSFASFALNEINIKRVQNQQAPNFPKDEDVLVKK
jgi:hypothetical protein